MSGVLQSKDAFSLTFGKENWKALSENQTQVQGKTKSTIKNSKNLFNKQLERKTGTKVIFGEIKKQKLIALCELSKQNIVFNDQTNTKDKRNSSSIHNNGRRKSHSFSIRQQVEKEKRGKAQLQQKSQNFSPYYIELNEKLNQIEINSKSRTDRMRIISQFRNCKRLPERKSIFSQPNQNLFYDDSQRGKNEKLCFSQIGKYKSNIYQDEMNRIDGLIDKINTRIKVSTQRFA